MQFYCHMLFVSITCLILNLVMLHIAENDIFYIPLICCAISISVCLSVLSVRYFSFERFWNFFGNGLVFKRDDLPSGLTKHIVQTCRCCCGYSR